MTRATASKIAVCVALSFVAGGLGIVTPAASVASASPVVTNAAVVHHGPDISVLQGIREVAEAVEGDPSVADPVDEDVTVAELAAEHPHNQPDPSATANR